MPKTYKILNQDEIKLVREWVRQGREIGAIAKYFGCSRKTVENIRDGKGRFNVPEHR